MNAAIRWRIVTLQAVLVVVLAAAGGFALFEGTFVTGMIHNELVSQQISFPGTDQIKAGGALDPAKFSAEIRNYAGQPVDNGDKARVYANDFIGVHLQGVAKGQTYSQVSAALSAANTKLAAMSKDDPGAADRDGGAGCAGFRAVRRRAQAREDQGRAEDRCVIAVKDGMLRRDLPAGAVLCSEV